MPEKNLWGELPTKDLIRTPYLILREQAALLGEKTDSLLVGEVELENRYGTNSFRLVLKIVAPTLDNYAYTVLNAEHDLNLYPVSEGQSGYTSEHEKVKCKDEDEFVQELGRILSSEKVKKVVRNLLSQVKS